VSIALRGRLTRLDGAIATARATGDRRRELSLVRRRGDVGARLAAEGAPGRGVTARVERLVGVLPAPLRRTVVTRARSLALDRAARSPAAAARRAASSASIAALGGLTPVEYARLPERQRRAARIEIVRQLERRAALLGDRRPSPLTIPFSRGAHARGAEPGRDPEDPVARRRRQFRIERP
jgi:hypothetical protein